MDYNPPSTILPNLPPRADPEAQHDTPSTSMIPEAGPEGLEEPEEPEEPADEADETPPEPRRSG